MNEAAASPIRSSSSGVRMERPTSTGQVKKKADDFIFGQTLGEGSYSTVVLVKEISTGKEFAVKILEKAHITREKKTKYVHREKKVFNMIDNHPFFVRLWFTFQDVEKLYFGLSYARGGELLKYIRKLGCFDEKCTQFYSAEVISALEYLHSLGIVHRDLKPENILLNDEMHIQITDFGSAKIVEDDTPELGQSNKRRHSFVGTAQYVSPELLVSKNASYSSDLWALGCIVYQLLSGHLPFWGGHEYQIFLKIQNLEYTIPEGFNATGRDLVERLLVLEPDDRLGSEKTGGFKALKQHSFYTDICFDTLPKTKPPPLVPFLPATEENSQPLWSDIQSSQGGDSKNTQLILDGIDWTTDERQKKLENQRSTNKYHKFVNNKLILKQGLVDKRKGLFARRRMLLLTEGPRFYYVDPQAMVLKGEIPWSKDLKPEQKNFKIFFVHTPNRTYYLVDPENSAEQWCTKIQDVWNHYYGESGAS